MSKAGFDLESSSVTELPVQTRHPPDCTLVLLGCVSAHSIRTIVDCY